MKIRYGNFVDPARGGRKIEERIKYAVSTVKHPDGITVVNTQEVWLDIGTLMEPIKNHVPEQPKSLAQKLLEAHIEKQREVYGG